jgi:hypothetical protein
MSLHVARHRFPLGRLVAGVLLLLAAPSVLAGGLYRCSGKRGELAYTNKPAGYHNCVLVSSYSEAPPPKPVAIDGKQHGKVTYHAPSPPSFANVEGWPPNFANVVAGPQPASFVNVIAGPAAPSFANVIGSGRAFSPPRPSMRKLLAPRTDYLDVEGEDRSGIISGNPALAQTQEASSTSAGDTPRVLRGAVYKVAKANGITEYTNIKPRGHYQVLFTYMATCYACDVRSTVNFGAIALNLSAFKDEIAQAAAATGLDESLLRAVIHAESAFNPNALSIAGAQGLMQLMPGTAGDLGVNDPFEPSQNIRGGAYYLANLLKNYAGDERRALAAYNAGPANVDKYGGVPPFDETRVYVDRVAVLRDRYKKAN